MTFARARPAIVFATRSGGTTIDQDVCGGNPFATALIELAGADRISLRRLPRRLRALTVQASQGHQVPQWTSWPQRLKWTLQLRPGSSHERRCALVLIVSDYTRAGLIPLTGAAHDERRISAMLAANGFSVVQGIAPTRTALLRALASFGHQAREHDVALVYSTGHGLECNGRVYLLPGDYPLAEGCSPPQLRAKAVSVERIAAACRAARLNLVFFAGCRTLAGQPGESMM
jgi:hypothetical protein